MNLSGCEKIAIRTGSAIKRTEPGMWLALRLTNDTYKITNGYPSSVFIATNCRVVRILGP